MSSEIAPEMSSCILPNFYRKFQKNFFLRFPRNAFRKFIRNSFNKFLRNFYRSIFRSFFKSSSETPPWIFRNKKDFFLIPKQMCRQILSEISPGFIYENVRENSIGILLEIFPRIPPSPINFRKTLFHLFYQDYSRNFLRNSIRNLKAFVFPSIRSEIIPKVSS